METVKEIITYYQDELKTILDDRKVKKVRDINQVHERTRAEDYENFLYHLNNLDKVYYIQIESEYWENEMKEQEITNPSRQKTFIDVKMKEIQEAVKSKNIETVIASNNSFKLIEIYQKDIPVLIKESKNFIVVLKKLRKTDSCNICGFAKFRDICINHNCVESRK